MKAHTRETRQLAAQAADWVVRLEDEPTSQDRAELVNWLRLSPRHIEEFLLAQAAYRAFHEAGSAQSVDVQALLATEAGTVVALRDDSAAMVVSTSRRMGWRMKLAAALAVAAVGASAWVIPWPGGEVYTTSTGEQRTLRLADGSRLTLNTGSKVNIDFPGDSRAVTLVRGEAWFEVEPDARRPFHVYTPTAVIQVLGTQFNVYERPDGARVSVLEGAIQLTAPGTSATQKMTAGQQADVTGGKVLLNPEADLTGAIAWRERRLVFRGTPLADVVREFNRYSERPIRLKGDALSQRRISGVFHADDPGTIFKFLRAESSVTVKESAREITIETTTQTTGPGR